MNTTGSGLAWNSLGVFQGLFSDENGTTGILCYIFFAGLVMALISLFNKNDSSIDKKSDILNLLMMICVLAAFIFIIRAPRFEYRWFFPLIIGVLAFTSKALVIMGDIISLALKDKPIGKILSVLFIIIVLGFGLADQLRHTDTLTKIKLNSYAEVKSAALWMKENSAKTDILSSISYTQTAYYSERKVLSYAELNNSEQFEDFLEKNNPRFITVSIYEPHPEWIYNWTYYNQENQKIYPAAAWFADEGGTQPLLIIYGFAKNAVPLNESCEKDLCSI
jgi:hypothetical protein